MKLTLCKIKLGFVQKVSSLMVRKEAVLGMLWGFPARGFNRIICRPQRVVEGLHSRA